MKKIIILFFVLALTVSTQSFAAETTPNSEKVQALKQDKDFLNFYNAQFNFIAVLSKSKKIHLFQKFTAQTASKSEIAELAMAVGYENEVALNNFLLNQSSLIKYFSLNNTFLKNTDGQKILSSALIELAKEGKFEAFSKTEVVDCLAVFMLTSASCYGTYEACINDNGSGCLYWLTLCLTGMFESYERCHDLELS